MMLALSYTTPHVYVPGSGLVPEPLVPEPLQPSESTTQPEPTSDTSETPDASWGPL